jgi:hypothetical protein
LVLAGRCSSDLCLLAVGLGSLADTLPHFRDHGGTIEERPFQAFGYRHFERFHLGLVFQVGLLQRTDGRPDDLAGIVILAAPDALLNIAVEFVRQTDIPCWYGFPPESFILRWDGKVCHIDHTSTHSQCFMCDPMRFGGEARRSRIIVLHVRYVE